MSNGPEYYVSVPSMVEEDEDGVFPNGTFGSSPETQGPPVPTTARVLSLVCLREALEPLKHTLSSAAELRTLVVVVPTTQWCAPLEAALKELRSGKVFVRDGSERSNRDLDRFISARLIDEKPITLVCTELRSTPRALRVGADLVVSIAPPSRPLICDVINQVGRGHIALDETPDVAGLDFDELIAIIRRDRSVEDIDAALRAAVALRVQVPNPQSVPDLATSSTFGAAGAWGRDLAMDITALRAGQIGWPDVDRGCVVYGPPGTGKTLFARALAAHCRLPIVSGSIGELFATSSGDLGAVIVAARKLFAQARACAPCVLFLDELDALPSRAGLSDRGRDWWTSLITDFLTMIDGAVSDRDGIIVLGATNAIEMVDAALLRPGRLERAIYLGPPVAEGLAEIVRHHLGDDLADADLLPLCRLAVGATGAVAMEWVRAARRAARRAGRPLLLGDLQSIMSAGQVDDPETVRRIAVHEAGHVVVAHAMGLEVVGVTIGGSGAAGGATGLRGPAAVLPTAADIRAQVVVMLAGRAAEEVVIGEPSVGAGGAAESDLARATKLVSTSFANFGLGDTLLYEGGPDAAIISLLNPERRSSVSRYLDDAYTEAVMVVRRYHDVVVKIADELFSRKVLGAEDLRSLIGKLRDPACRARSR